MTSTRKLRTGILSDASILSECPTAFAQGGGRTYGLVTIAGAPNEMAQRPKRADGLINTLSRKSGESTDALTQMYSPSSIYADSGADSYGFTSS